MGGREGREGGTAWQGSKRDSDSDSDRGRDSESTSQLRQTGTHTLALVLTGRMAQTLTQTRGADSAQDRGVRGPGGGVPS
eukprot:3907167-Rhodomonas_salina.2